MWNFYGVWDKKEVLKVVGLSLTLRGHSVSARQSGFYIDEWKLMLDAGIVSPYPPSYICVTHGHSDHSYELPMIITGTSSAATVLVPFNTAELFNNLLRSKYELSSDGDINYQPPVSLIAIADAVEMDLDQISGQKLTLMTFTTYHSVCSVGYAFFQRRQRLKP